MVLYFHLAGFDLYSSYISSLRGCITGKGPLIAPAPALIAPTRLPTADGLPPAAQSLWHSPCSSPWTGCSRWPSTAACGCQSGPLGACGQSTSTPCGNWETPTEMGPSFPGLQCRCAALFTHMPSAPACTSDLSARWPLNLALTHGLLCSFPCSMSSQVRQAVPAALLLALCPATLLYNHG